MHQTNIHIWVVHYIVQQSALNAMKKNQIQHINHSSPQNLFILNSGFLRGKTKLQNFDMYRTKVRFPEFKKKCDILI